MGNTRHAFIKSILHIFTEKSYSKLLSYLLKKENKGRFAWFVQQLCLRYHKIGLSLLNRVAPTTLLRLPQYWAIFIGNICQLIKKLYEIDVFLGGDLNFTRVFTWDVYRQYWCWFRQKIWWTCKTYSV